MIYDTDLISSIVKHLEEQTFTIKDLRDTPTAETRSGTLSTLFPGMKVVHARIFDVESLPIPSIGVGVEMQNQPRETFFCGGAVYQHAARIVVTGAALQEGEENYDRTLLITSQLRSILADHFKTERTIPWYRFSFDDNGTATLYGEFLCRDFTPFDVDEGRFIASFTLECADDA